MNKNKATEAIVENAAKAIIEDLGEELAGALVEYHDLVKQLAEDLTYEQLEESSYIKSLLEEQLPDWDEEDWSDLTKAVRSKKRNNERPSKYSAICRRAEAMRILQTGRIEALMDIESAEQKFNLRLDDLLEANDFNFAHDFIGIQNNIERDGFPAIDFGLFVPRFAGRKEGENE